ncbi:pyocin knob domain-containing protein [Lentilactobacillus kosonis]|uniref:Uncharacterized protein n=1 Tax=Lentilactobacillus kosonis TaxID=2810561 RepID=A0A401FPI3_9LACO|nr:pyocin knob domain-containing protein [Lentilactobacillus kosonis]GAY74299.1 hypothetical protein NBRC111893_2445 [Lentilactobacillus kosonis]
MATENVGIITNAGKNLINRVNAGETSIHYTKIVFSTDDLSDMQDAQIKELVTIQTQNVTVAPPTVTLIDTTGETKIRAIGLNHINGNDKADLTDGIYVKTYGIFAKDDSGKEILYSVSVTTHPDYLPAYDGMIVQAITYSYTCSISDTDKVEFTDSKDVLITLDDLNEKTSGFVKSSDLQNYATKADVNGLATTEYVDQALQNNKLPTDIMTTDTVQKVTSTKTFQAEPISSDGSGYLTSNSTKNWQKFKISDDSGMAFLSTADVNTLTNPGIYFTKNPTHVPDTGAWWFIIVFVSPDTSTTVVKQKAYGDNYDMEWDRTSRNGTWSTWSKRPSGIDLQNALKPYATSDSITAINNVINALPSQVISDTRTVAWTPKQYMDNGRKETREFKNNSVVGLPGSGYSEVWTDTPWDNNSGGFPTQVAKDTNKLEFYLRIGTSDTDWGNWQKITPSQVMMINSDNKTVTANGQTGIWVDEDYINNLTNTITNQVLNSIVDPTTHKAKLRWILHLEI